MRIGEVFRYSSSFSPSTETIDGLPNFINRTYFADGRRVLLEKGINPIARVKAHETWRIPAILISSSPHNVGSRQTPWQDFFSPDEGRVRYFGDNKSNTTDPSKRPGNKALLQQFAIHQSTEVDVRKTAVPILFFKRVTVGSRVKGNVEFNGFGIISQVELVVQFDQRTRENFSNYAFDFTVLNLAKENELFDWGWINARRDKSISTDEADQLAPDSWKNWIREGRQVLPRLSRNVAKLLVVPTEEQVPALRSKEEGVLKEIFRFYSRSSAIRQRFEYLAAVVTEHVINATSSNYRMGWVTSPGSDGGADFIGRLDVGEGFGAAKLVVLGQAKCEALHRPTGGNHIARTVARLKRGWLGVYVTTSYFSSKVQREVIEDKFPLLLINGKALAEAVYEILQKQGFNNVREYLEYVDSQYEGAIRQRAPEQILLD